MNQGESKRGNRLAVCDSPDRELEAGAINPVILSSAPVSNFQFQISPAYDPLGRLASTTAGGVTVRHIYDGIHCVADTDSSGRVVKSYTWGPGIDNLLAVTCHSGSSSTTYYALTDIQGTVHGFADASGNLFETYAYDAWGNLLAVRDASGLPIQNLKSPIGNRYLFQGREYSHATGLYNFRLRWYDPATGRWLSKDPIGISGGLNLYAFCGNDPVNYVDPWGLKQGELIYFSRKPGSDFPYHVGYDMGDNRVVMFRPSSGSIEMWVLDDFMKQVGYGIAGRVDISDIISYDEFMTNVLEQRANLECDSETMCVDMPVAGFGDKWLTLKANILADYRRNPEPYKAHTPEGPKNPYFFRRNTTFKQYWISQKKWMP